MIIVYTNNLFNKNYWSWRFFCSILTIIATVWVVRHKSTIFCFSRFEHLPQRFGRPTSPHNINKIDNELATENVLRLSTRYQDLHQNVFQPGSGPEQGWSRTFRHYKTVQPRLHWGRRRARPDGIRAHYHQNSSMILLLICYLYFFPLSGSFQGNC